jgi:hypothetical protein
VQRTIASYLADRRKLPIYNSSSFGFLKDLGTRAAIEVAMEYRRSHDWCLKTDIESFFDRIPRQYLKDRLSIALPGHSLVPVISKIIDCEVKITQSNRPQIHRHGIQMGVGVRQGMPLSPILANLVLSEFDKKMERRGLKMVRYADDIAIFFETKQKAQEGHRIVSDALAAIKLTIPGLVADSKTQIIGPSDPIDFLGWEIARVGADNKVVPQIAKRQIRKIAKKLEDEYSLHKLMKADSTFQEAIVEITNSISGYLVVYRNAYNFASIDSQLRFASRKIIGDIFAELFGENAVSNIGPEEKRFLGMSQVAFGDLTSDLDP